jgi:hypothetical protein
MNNWQSFYPLKNKDGYSGSNKQKSWTVSSEWTADSVV